MQEEGGRERGGGAGGWKAAQNWFQVVDCWDEGEVEVLECCMPERPVMVRTELRVGSAGGRYA